MRLIVVVIKTIEVQDMPLGIRHVKLEKPSFGTLD